MQARKRTRAGALVAAAWLGACGGGNRYAPPPPPEVAVSHPLEREVTTYSEFTGRTVAIEALDVRARVQGYLQSLHFTPGSEVKKGDLLFVIEPTLYQSAVDQAKADLEGKLAQAKAAQAQLEITEAIFQRQAGSRTDLVQKTQARDLAKAQVEVAKANLAASELNLSYTHIYAPIDGHIDRNLVDVGNLVGAGSQPTLLASIVRDDPIYVYFTASERQLLQYLDLQRQNRTVTPTGQHNTAFLGLVNEEGYPHSGMVDYAGNRVDPATGTIEIRAVFPNADRHILAGLFARVRLPFTRERAVLVPAVATSSDQGGDYLLVVDAENKVQYRHVRLGPALEGGLQIVQEGVKPEDWIVVNGLQKARPGTVVKPQPSEIQATVPTPLASVPMATPTADASASALPRAKATVAP